MAKHKKAAYLSVNSSKMSEKIGLPVQPPFGTDFGEARVRRRTIQPKTASARLLLEYPPIPVPTWKRARTGREKPRRFSASKETDQRLYYKQAERSLEQLGETFQLNSEYLAHSLRLEQMMDLLAEMVGIPQGSLDRLFLNLGARYHDIGKIRCIDLIMLPTILTPEQREVTHEHPEQGAEMIPERFDIVREIVRTHHRDPIGGYPETPFNKEVLAKLEHPIAQLLAEWALGTLDPLEAMWSDRPYRDRPLTLEESEAELRLKSGTEFHPEIVELLVGEKRIIEHLYHLHRGTKDNPGIYHLHTEHDRHRNAKVYYAKEIGYDSSGQGRVHRVPYYLDRFSPYSWIIRQTKRIAKRQRSTLKAA